jgi:hypothetical protein
MKHECDLDEGFSVQCFHARLLEGVKRFRSVHMYAFDF